MYFCKVFGKNPCHRHPQGLWSYHVPWTSVWSPAMVHNSNINKAQCCSTDNKYHHSSRQQHRPRTSTWSRTTQARDNSTIPRGIPGQRYQPDLKQLHRNLAWTRLPGAAWPMDCNMALDYSICVDFGDNMVININKASGGRTGYSHM